jgi:uncharacterized protein (TIGR03435 family)
MILRSLLLIAFAAPAIRAQSGPAFEVASVKPATEDDRNGISLFSFPGGRITVTKFRLKQLVEVAYGVQSYQIVGAPAWMDVDRFDIEARPAASSEAAKDRPPSPKSPPSPEVLRMLQTLLEDRFQLKVHRETREASILALTMVKGGHKLTPTEKPDAKPFVSNSRTGPVTESAITNILSGQNAPISLLTTALAGRFKRPVVDQTGLKGSYDFRVEFAADDGAPQGPSIYAALQEQLGLKLENTKGPSEVLVIDRVEKLARN